MLAKNMLFNRNQKGKVTKTKVTDWKKVERQM